MNPAGTDLAQVPAGLTQAPAGLTQALAGPSQSPAGLTQVPAGLTQAPAGPAQSAPADPAALLALLRDIQLPAAIPWWPPAPGWWLLPGIALLAYLGWRRRWYAGWRRMLARSPPPVTARVAALDEIARARAAFAADGDARVLVSGLSVLLRRVAMEFASRDEVASLTGQRWLEWLDARVEGESFSAGPGRVLADAPYRASAVADFDGDALLGICEEWVLAVSRAASPRSAA